MLLWDVFCSISVLEWKKIAICWYGLSDVFLCILLSIQNVIWIPNLKGQNCILRIGLLKKIPLQIMTKLLNLYPMCFGLACFFPPFGSFMTAMKVLITTCYLVIKSHGVNRVTESNLNFTVWDDIGR